MKNILRKLHIGGNNNDDQLDAGRIIEGRSFHDSSGGQLSGRESSTGTVTSSNLSGSPTGNEPKPPSGFSTFLHAVKDSVGRVGQSPSLSNEKSTNPITNVIGQLRHRLDSSNSREGSGGAGELDSLALAAKRAGSSPPGSFKRGGYSPTHRSSVLANETPKEVATLTVLQSEKDYQMQIAMVLGLSGDLQDANAVRVVENAQIEAAKRLSLGLSPAVGHSQPDQISYRYWARNVVDFTEVVPDGFYDVFGVNSDSSLSERMPLLADLQKMPISDTSRIEVVLVDRQRDPDLLNLEKKAGELVYSAEAEDVGSLRTNMSQKLALIVAEQMGGPVGSETDMLLRWQKTTLETKSTMQNVVLTLGSLTIGLTRHRALLFKVLADHVGIPCQLVKGRHYPGVEEEGAVNIIRVDDNREYFIDLMGAPGTLIPSDKTVTNSSEVVSDDSCIADVSPNSTKTENSLSSVSSTQSSPSSSTRSVTDDHNKERKGVNTQKVTDEEATEGRLGNVKLDSRHHSEPVELQCLDVKPARLGAARPAHLRSQSWTDCMIKDNNRQQINDVSQVFDAAKENPELAQKLHEVLLESGVIADIAPKQLQGQSFEDKKSTEDKNVFQDKKPGLPVPAHPPRKKNSTGQGRPPSTSLKETQRVTDESLNPKDRLQRLNSVEGLGDRRPLEPLASEVPSLPSPSSQPSPPLAPPQAFPAISSPLAILENSGAFVPVAAAAAAAATAAVVASTMVAAAAKGDGDTRLDVPIAAAATATAAVVAATSAVAGRKVDSNESSPLNSNDQPGGSGERRQSDNSEKARSGHILRHSDERRFGTDDSIPGNDNATLSAAGDGLDGEVSAEEERNSEMMSRSIKKRYDAELADVAEWEIPWEDIVVGERIGLGSYGEVYRGDWHGSEIAVKKFLDQDLSGDALEEFRSEVRIMRRLRHPNVVLFMGAIMRAPHLSIVTEFLPRGSLYRLIHRPNNQLDARRRLRMALDVAKGMNYLHSGNPVIVHRDLKSPNLLVDKNWVVKVCDFGLSRMKHNTFLSSKSTAGTPEWMAPEMLRNEPSNEKCDVYSFGVILWELATLQQPWGGMNPMQVVGAVGFQHRRLDIPPDMDPGLARIIRECWHDNPNLRPSFAQLMAALRPLQRPLSAAQVAEASKSGQLSQSPTIQSQPQQQPKPQEEPILS